MFFQHSHEIKIPECFTLNSETVQCTSEKLKMTQVNSWVGTDGNYSHWEQFLPDVGGL